MTTLTIETTTGRREAAEGEGAGARAILVDDQLLFRLGLRWFLSRALPSLAIMGEADTAAEGVALAELTRPDLALLDASLPDAPAEDTVRRVLEAAPHCRVMLLVNLPDRRILSPALRAGAHGCALKTIAPEQLVTALRRVMAGGKWVQPELTQAAAGGRAPTSRPDAPARPLTGREMEVLHLIVAGYSNAEIGRALGISEQTVKTHLAHLMRKIRVRSRLQAARYAISRGLVEV